MTRIYTRTGDAGETGLWGGSRVPKSHPRVRAYGEIDELNCVLGAALASLPRSRAFAPLREALGRAQAELFTAGALLAAPPGREASLPPALRDGFPPEAAERLEREIDRMTADLPPLKRFILPGGSAAGSWLHVCRAVCRRAERAACALPGGEAPPGVVRYLNRLSDHLFTAARWANARLRSPETQWGGLVSRGGRR